MCVALGRGLLFSGSSDGCLRSWEVGTMDSVAEVQVRYLSSLTKVGKVL